MSECPRYEDYVPDNLAYLKAAVAWMQQQDEEYDSHDAHMAAHEQLVRQIAEATDGQPTRSP